MAARIERPSRAVRSLCLLFVALTACAHRDLRQNQPCDGYVDYPAEGARTEPIAPLHFISADVAACAREPSPPSEVEKKARDSLAEGNFEYAALFAVSAFEHGSDRRVLLVAAEADEKLKRFADEYELLAQYSKLACSPEEVEAVRPSIESAERQSGEVAIECEDEAKGVIFTTSDRSVQLQCGERVRLNVQEADLFAPGIGTPLLVDLKAPMIVARKRIVIRVRRQDHPC